MKKLMNDSEMLSDVRSYDAAKARIERGDDEIIPLEIIERRLAGESTVKIWREYRELTQESLARASFAFFPTTYRKFFDSPVRMHSMFKLESAPVFARGRAAFL